MIAVTLPDDLEAFIRETVTNGTFPDESTVLSEAVRLLQRREQLKRDVLIGIEQLDRGETIPADEVFKNLEMKLRNRGQAQ